MNKLVITGPNLPGALPDLEKFCRLHNLVLGGCRGAVGRPRADVPVQNLLDAYHKEKTIRGTARRLGLSPGTAWRRLREAGAIS